MRRFLPAIFSATLLAAGCSQRNPASPTVNLQSGGSGVLPDNQDRGEILVWATKGEGGPPRTFRLAAEGSLTVLGEQDGIVIATTHGELTWQAKEKEIDLSGCEHYDGSPATPSKGTITPANLVNKAGEVVQKVVDFNELSEKDVDELQHHVGLAGSIGPYLFISENSYVYACGAHGNVAVSALIWDAESGKTIDLWGELPEQDKLAEVARKQLDVDEEQGSGEESSKPDPAQFVPVYGDRGALRLDAQFARWACYACSDGQWSSYTRSAIVPTNWVPERMRAWVMPPVVVKEFLESRRDWRLGGWSKR